MTIQYYNDNAQSFVDGTVNVDMESLYSPFVKLLPDNALILDAGCGSGRDTRAFLSMGFDVEAIDASEEMVRHATAYTGINVKQQTFQDIDVSNSYDAIWACASLLHVPQEQLLIVFSRLEKALKAGGVWYFSFKYGNEERVKDGRTFTDMNEESIRALLSQFPTLMEESVWLTLDARPDRDEKWLNVIVRKV
ncbi:MULTISPECIES: class I SAM-dependent methyltransferase [unclassified Photobacterium]|uniref:class I SAM-dependent methyltransferase n=1 Tax=unclassified Photobacterium TaxID=2628852 RepID=UPI001EE0C773|nr:MULTISPECIES: class I SAM-dependent methyltransferase [unclassified Photobacterium]MCG3864472.1 class I SAM-dependent methyltransferase [Photobacterium sp. Ph6]MCG3877435.1 class I SAM-dependent methyltransferase [Photobacterium sp. Ph5]